MTKEERDELIMEKLNSGMSLSDLQKLLDSEYGLKMTYFDLRMIVSDLKIEWENQAKKHKPDVASAPKAAAPAVEQLTPEIQEESDNGEVDETNELEDETEGEDEEPAEAASEDGGTSVTIDDTPMRGAILSGSVRFASGASGKWMMNQMGQLGLASLDEGSEKPTQDDLMLFQKELQATMKAYQEALEQQAFDGRTQVEISPLMKPGCDLNGTVTFASGAKGEWFIVTGGNLDFSLDEGSSQPTANDMKLFEIVLRSKLREKGYA